MSIEVPKVNLQHDYIVSVLPRSPGGARDTGSYFLAADFNRTAPTEFGGVTTDTLAAATTKTATLTVNEAATFEFALSAETFTSASAGVVMTLFDAGGQAVLTMTADSDKPLITGVRYLNEGTYTVRYAYRSMGGTTPDVQYSLYLLQLSEGAGPYQTTTGSSGSESSPQPSGSSGGYTYSGSSTTRPSGAPYYF
jgi:hypothetical protein